MRLFRSFYAEKQRSKKSRLKQDFIFHDDTKFYYLTFPGFWKIIWLLFSNNLQYNITLRFILLVYRVKKNLDDLTLNVGPVWLISDLCITCLYREDFKFYPLKRKLNWYAQNKKRRKVFKEFWFANKVLSFIIYCKEWALILDNSFGRFEFLLPFNSTNANNVWQLFNCKYLHYMVIQIFLAINDVSCIHFIILDT